MSALSRRQALSLIPATGVAGSAVASSRQSQILSKEEIEARIVHHVECLRLLGEALYPEEDDPDGYYAQLTVIWMNERKSERARRRGHEWR